DRDHRVLHRRRFGFRQEELGVEHLGHGPDPPQCGCGAQLNTCSEVGLRSDPTRNEGVPMVAARDARAWAADGGLHGIGDSLYTPFAGRDGDDIDWDAYRTLVRYCVGDLGHAML